MPARVWVARVDASRGDESIVVGDIGIGSVGVGVEKTLSARRHQVLVRPDDEPELVLETALILRPRDDLAVARPDEGSGVGQWVAAVVPLAQLGDDRAHLADLDLVQIPILTE